MTAALGHDFWFLKGGGAKEGAKQDRNGQSILVNFVEIGSRLQKLFGRKTHDSTDDTQCLMLNFGGRQVSFEIIAYIL